MAVARSIDDRWFLLGAVVVLYVATFGVRHAITDIVRLTEITPLGSGPSTGKIVVGDDDSSPDNSEGQSLTIRLSTLRSLLKSPHDNINSSARSIIVQRLCSDPLEIRGLVSDSYSDDVALRCRARRGIEYLRGATAIEQSWGESKTIIARQARDIICHLHGEHRPSTEPEFWSRLSPAICDWAGVRPSRGKRSASTDEVTSVARQRPISRGANSGMTSRQRRHREAMVLHEGDGAISEDDIFRPRREW